MPNADDSTVVPPKELEPAEVCFGGDASASDWNVVPAMGVRSAQGQHDPDRHAFNRQWWERWKLSRRAVARVERSLFEGRIECFVERGGVVDFRVSIKLQMMRSGN